MNIEDIKNMIEEYEDKPKILVVRFDLYFQLKEEIDALGIDFIVDDRLPEKTKAIVMNGDIFDAIYHLEKESDVK